MNFQQARGAFRAPGTAEPLAPAKTTTIQPGEFSDEWPKKPKSPIVVGIRLLSAAETSTAEEWALKRTAESELTGDEAVTFFNERATEWIVSRTICDPNDVSKPHPTFPFAEDTVPVALTRPAIARLFDEFELHLTSSSPLYPEANDDELTALSVLLCEPALLGVLDPAVEGKLRRYAHVILSTLSAHLPEEEPSQVFPDA